MPHARGTLPMQIYERSVWRKLELKSSVKCRLLGKVNIGTKGPGFQTKPYEARAGRRSSTALRRESHANHGPGCARGTARRSYSTALPPDARLLCSALLGLYIYQIYNVKHLDTSIRMHDKNKTYHNLISLLIKINSKIL